MLKLCKILLFTVLISFFSSCEKEYIGCESCNQQQIIDDDEKNGTYCSFPFSAVSVVNTNGISQNYNLVASQTTDKKWRWRSTTSGGLPFRKFRVKVTNNHSSYPIIFRAVGVKCVFSEAYYLLGECYTVNAGQSKTIRFDNVEPLCNPNTYNREYLCIDWEIIVKNGNELGLTATTVPVSVELA